MNQIENREAEGEPVFNMKAVANRTGLNPATVRAWERRYGLPNPDRSSGGHRQYSQDDIDTLRWLVARQEEGVSISHAVDLWRAYEARGEDPFLAEQTAAKMPGTQVLHIVEGAQIEQLRREWVSACMAFDRVKAEQILANAFALFNPETVCFELLQAGLAEIGTRWFLGKVTVQQEHFASALSIQRLEMLIAAAPSPSRPERILVATAPGDHHVFSPLLLTYLLRKRGWEVIYLGADVPENELESTIADVRPELIVVSAQLLYTAATLKEVALKAQSLQVPLAFGGLVFNQIPQARRLIPGYFLGESLEDAVQWITEAMRKKQPPAMKVNRMEDTQRDLDRYREHRALIESHVWGVFIENDRSTENLPSINERFAKTIEAALFLGEVELLKPDLAWIEQLLMDYRLTQNAIADYVAAYHQAAQIHLGDSAGIVSWLSLIASD